MARIKLELRNVPLPQLVTKAQRVATMSTGNTTFTSISAKVTSFNTALTALTTADAAYQTAQQAADQKLTERDNKRTDLENQFRQLASAAEGVTMDGAQLESGGWDLRGTAAPVGDMTAPQNLTVSYGDMAGEVDMQWDPVRGASAYIMEHATNATGPWTRFCEGTKSRCTAGGLTSGQVYYFRVAAVGANGTGPWSDIAEKRASNLLCLLIQVFPRTIRRLSQWNCAINSTD